MLFYSHKVLAIISLLYFSKSLCSAFQLCLPLGPTVPPATFILQSTLFQQVLQNITSVLDDTGTGEQFGVDFNTTSFSISIFSTSTSTNSTPSNNPFLWQYHHSAPSLKNAASGVKTVDADSIYRIGSLTKVFTVLGLLINAGDTHWDQPITRYVSELATAAKFLNTKDYVAWNDIILGNLASHMSGIGRDYVLGELLVSAPEVAQLLPLVNASRVPPCGLNPLCTRAQFFVGFTQRPPVYLPSTTPVYSNAAYQILGYALENITNKSFESLLNESIFDPLKMIRSSLSVPTNSSNGVIPVNETVSWWAVDAGDEAPAGSMFTTLHDISIAGRAILSSDLLKPVQTRRWLKPVAYTASPLFSLGRPWEITTLPSDASTPTVNVYAKEGNLGLYSSYMALVPDYDIGVTILQVDSVSSPVPDKTALFIARMLVTTLQEIGQQQAQANIGGAYIASDSSNVTTVSMTIVANDGLPGIAVTNFNTSSTDFLALYASLSGIEPENASLRLYQTNVQSRSSNGVLKTAYRSVLRDTSVSDDGSSCITRAAMDTPTYGGFALDDFLISFKKDGMVDGFEVPAWSLTLNKL